jgi:hypothetical protein
MRRFVAGLVLSVAVLLPKVGNAQVSPFRTPTPEVNAAAASWQVNSEPMTFEGLIFYPTREYRQFDGQVMAQIGVYEGVPVYADTTIEPWSLVYVPVGRERVRAFERARTRELEGTSGSRSASFATMPSSGGSPVTVTPSSAMVPSVAERPVGTAGSVAPRATGMNSYVANIPERSRATRTRIETIPQPRATSAGGVWLEFNGNRWYSAGSAVPFVSDRFTPVGQYRGFTVYRATTGDRDRIWVAVVPDGPVAPYEKR